MSGSLAEGRRRVEISGNYSADGTEGIIAVVGLALSLTITLPSPATVGCILPLVVKDETGLATSILTITLTPASGLIDGAASLVVNSAFGVKRVYSSGGAWFSA